MSPASTEIEDTLKNQNIEKKTTTMSKKPVILPFRTTARPTTTTTTTEATVTTDGSPAGVLSRILSEAAAPIAGLSAATLAYSAAAMLPVWLPAALAGRRRRDLVASLSQAVKIAIEKNYKL